VEVGDAAAGREGAGREQRPRGAERKPLDAAQARRRRRRRRRGARAARVVEREGLVDLRRGVARRPPPRLPPQDDPAPPRPTPPNP
jgi:hypothetical protein